jgi:hypothetical protein
MIMNEQVESYYQEIGAEAIDSVPAGVSDILLYTEVEDGMVSCSLFFLESDKKVHYRECSIEFHDLMYEFWEKWQDVADLPAFATMTYRIKNGSFDIEMTYPDQLDNEEGIHERRQRLLEQTYGTTEVNYSSP